MSVAFDFPESVDGDASGFADCGKIVSFEVYEHIVLGNLFGVLEKRFDDGTIRRSSLSLIGSTDGAGRYAISGLFDYRFGRATQDGEILGQKQEGFGGGVCQTKPFECKNRINLGLGFETLGNLDLIGFAIEYCLPGLPEDVLVLVEFQIAGNGLICPENGRGVGWRSLVEKIGYFPCPACNFRLDAGCFGKEVDDCFRSPKPPVGYGQVALCPKRQTEVFGEEFVTEKTDPPWRVETLARLFGNELEKGSFKLSAFRFE